jgi:hypothetical protein
MGKPKHGKTAERNRTERSRTEFRRGERTDANSDERRFGRPKGGLPRFFSDRNDPLLERDT